MVLWEAAILIAILFVLLYKWSVAKYGILRERGIPHEPPIPLFGSANISVLFGLKPLIPEIVRSHMKFKDCKIYGSYSFRNPMIIIRDVELIKKIGIKDFDSFPNHKTMMEFDEENIFNRSLLALRDLKWKEMRNTLTPTFTGSKMRHMFELINECCLEGVRYLQSETQASGKQSIDLEMKEYFTRFANDVIASAAFGIKVNSFREKSNEFFTIGRRVTSFSGAAIFRALLVMTMPKLTKLLRINIMNQKLLDYFDRLVLDAMKYREQHNIVRPDMIHLLMEAKKQYSAEQLKASVGNIESDGHAEGDAHAEFKDKDLVAQCLLFFFAGFETVSTCLCFTAHELLANESVQQRLYEEICETQQQLAGQPLNYDVLMKMRYMDMVLSESLRKWPPAIMTDRVCTKDYTLTDDDGNIVTELKKGDNVLLPIMGLHLDPENFPHPEKFDPERFSEENKNDIRPFTYLPFGVGPRNCIGNRLALMEIKALIYHMLLHFKIVPGEKTSKDLIDSIRGFKLEPKEKFWMKFVPRET